MNKELKKIIQSDFFRYYGEGGRYHFMWSLLNHSLKCIVTYRKANYYARHNKVNFDVPSNSIVIGNPGKIIENRPDATEGYCHNLFAVSSSENSC